MGLLKSKDEDENFKAKLRSLLKFNGNTLSVNSSDAYSNAVETLNSEWENIKADEKFLKELKILREKIRESQKEK